MNKCMCFSVRLIAALGIFENGNKWRVYWLKIFVSISLMTILFLSTLVELVHTSNDFSHFNDTLSVVLLEAMGAAKYTTLIYYSKRITDLRDKINDDKLNGDKSKIDDLVIEKYDRTGLYFSKIVAYVIIGAGMGRFLQNLPDLFLRDVRRLPFDLSYTYIFNSTGFFVIVYFQQLLSAYIFILAYVAANAWAIFLTYHACGNLCVLQNNLERIAEDEEWTEYQPMNTRQRIGKCVRLHQNICRMKDDIEDFFTVPNFVHFLVSAAGICTSAYELSSGNIKLNQLVKHVCTISGQFLQLFIANWCGQLIQDKSFGVSLAINRSNFHKLEVRHQKDIALILLRAQKPMCLTAGKFYNLSLPSMANILKGAISTFAMFTKMDD